MNKMVGHAAMLLVLVSLTTAGHAEDASNWVSKRGLFHLSFKSSIEPIAINRIHEWTVNLQTPDGNAIDDAVMTIEGGMPQHDHGLPTAPRVTENLGDGRYRIQGLRFHMAGAWIIEFTIEANGKTDTLTVELML